LLQMLEQHKLARGLLEKERQHIEPKLEILRKNEQ